MNSNPNLGRFDMVLALSQDKINAEFENLFDDGEISNTFELLTDLTGTKTRRPSDPDFKTIKKTWLEQEILLAQSDALNSEISSLVEQQTDYLSKDEFAKAKAISEQMKIKRKSLEDISQASKEIRKYSYLIDAVILSPEIQIQEKKAGNLLYKLRFDKGYLYSLNDNHIQKTDLSGKIYAFNVPVAKIRINADQMTLVDDKEEVLSAGGFDDNQFTIESIFLNFNNASIASYDKTESILPNDQRNRTDLQLAITNYFEGLKNTHQNYVLGYSVQKKNVNTSERAMLYPTAASFSTSHSTKERASAFNFLMLTDNKGLPKDNDSGILRASLIEQVINQDPPVDGTIAIDYPIFKELYLNNLNIAVADKLENGFRDKLGDAYKRRYQETDHTRFRFAMGKLWIDFKVHNPQLENVIMDDKSTAIRLTYRITANGNAHDEIPKSILLGAIDTGTIGVDQGVSTSGSWPIDGKKGSEGQLTLTIRASKGGKVHIDTQYVKPNIGKDTEKAVYKDNLDKYWDKLSSLVNPFGLAILIYKLFTDDGHDIANFDQDSFENIPFDNLDNFSSKIILPGSNTFTFQNVRSANNTFNNDDVILFDITYAPNTSVN